MPKTAALPDASSRTHRPVNRRTGPASGGSSRALSRGRLPGTIRASSRLPRAEFAVFLVLVPLLSIPVLLATMTATWATVTAVALTGVVAWLCAARSVVIGDGWVADRRLWHYRVTGGDQLRSVELVDSAHGGVLRLSPHTGRAHRLRRSEFDRPEARAALRTVLAAGSSTTNASARTALANPARTSTQTTR